MIRYFIVITVLSYCILIPSKALAVTLIDKKYQEQSNVYSFFKNKERDDTSFSNNLLEIYSSRKNVRSKLVSEKLIKPLSITGALFFDIVLDDFWGNKKLSKIRWNAFEYYRELGVSPDDFSFKTDYTELAPYILSSIFVVLFIGVLVLYKR